MVCRIQYIIKLFGNRKCFYQSVIISNLKGFVLLLVTISAASHPCLAALFLTLHYIPKTEWWKVRNWHCVAWASTPSGIRGGPIELKN